MSARTVPRPALGRGRPAEMLRFGLVGVSSTLLYFAVYSVGVLLGVAFALAAVAAFVISAACGYLLHDRWTFRANAASGAGLARWLALQGTVLGLNLLALWGLVQGAGLHRIVAQFALLPLIPLATYFMSRRRIFGAA